jgi:aerobic carbon-monoxide dehydrogenase small subunit
MARRCEPARPCPTSGESRFTPAPRPRAHGVVLQSRHFDEVAMVRARKSTKVADRRRAARKDGRPRGGARAVLERPSDRAEATRQAPQIVTLTVNGQRHHLEVGRDLAPNTTLSWLLRERLGHTGLKVSCDEGACGACTVIMDGKAVLSCMMLAVEADGHEILTIEGLPAGDPVVAAFAQQCEPGYGTALQCGYCTPGFVMAARALLDENPKPSLGQVKEALSGNLCRCGCYAGIAQAVLRASQAVPSRAPAERTTQKDNPAGRS